MVNGIGSAERRQAKRINVDLRVKIAKAVLAKGDRWDVAWIDVANMKNISHLGAYFEYRGSEQLNRGDVLRIDLDVSFPFAIKDMDESERLPMGGLASIVRTQQNSLDASVGVGVKFLEPLSMIFNSV